ncbi:hypothetical protein Tco_0501576, partial [Tanacetum coccineum]
SRGIKVFDGGSMGLKGGMAVVGVVVKWNDGGIGDGRSLDIGQVLATLVLYLGLSRVDHSSYFFS